MFQSIYELLDSQSECFRCGHEMFSEITKKLPLLQQTIKEVKKKTQNKSKKKI